MLFARCGDLKPEDGITWSSKESYSNVRVSLLGGGDLSVNEDRIINHGSRMTTWDHCVDCYIKEFSRQ